MAAAVPLATMLKRYVWAQRLVAQRGFTAMPLPYSTSAAASCETFLAEIAKASSPYVEAPASAPQPSFGIAPGPLAVLWQQARLNYLLPALAPPACIVCAIYIGLRQSGVRDGFAEAAVVEHTTLWLRRVLCPDLDDALGVEGFTAKHHITAEVTRLAADGLLITRPRILGTSSPTENGAIGNEDSGADISIAASGQQALAFCVALLAPLLCTYAAVLDWLMHTRAHGDTLLCHDAVAGILEWLEEENSSAVCCLLYTSPSPRD